MRKIALYLFCSILLFSDVLGQDTTSLGEKEDILEIVEVEKQAEFPGGNDAFIAYINKNLEYPKEALDNDVMGKVWIQFDVDKQGNVENVLVTKIDLEIGESHHKKKKRKRKTDKVEEIVLNPSDDYCLGTCAANLISNSPKWTPAMQKGKPVRIRYRLPINYKIY